MINYKGTPLLGEDSNPQHPSEFFAIAGTVLFWLIFSICSLVIKPQPDKPKYKEVQIVLSSTPVVQKTEEAPAPAEAASASAASSESVVEQVVETPAPKVEPAPVVKETPPAPKAVEKKVETPKPKPEPKKEAPKTQTQKTQTPVPAKKAERATLYSSVIKNSDSVQYKLFQHVVTASGKVIDEVKDELVCPISMETIRSYAKEVKYSSCEFYSDYNRTPYTPDSDKIICVLKK